VKKSELIRRLEEIHQDLPMEAMRQSRELGELIEELIAEKPRVKSKHGWLLSRWAGGKETFMVTWDVWTIWLRDAYVFAKEDVALKHQEGFSNLLDGRDYGVCKVVVGKNGKAMRRAKQ